VRSTLLYTGALLAVAGTAAAARPIAAGAADGAATGCGLISPTAVAHALGLPHARVVHQQLECRYLAWAQAQEPAGVRGPMPITVTVWTERSSEQPGRLSLDLALARRTAGFRRLRLGRLGQPHVAGFSRSTASRGQAGLSWSAQARGIWWSGRADRPQRGVEILVATEGPRPLSLTRDLARIAAIVVPALDAAR
jgi:hypothetical protein